MRWWFLASNHDVKIVILAKFDRHRDSGLLEKWEEEASRPRGQQLNGLEPILRQTITITRDATTDLESYSMRRGALVLSFQLLFLRDPRAQVENEMLCLVKGSFSGTWCGSGGIWNKRFGRGWPSSSYQQAYSQHVLQYF